MAFKNNRSRIGYSFFALAGLAAALVFGGPHGLTAAALPELGDMAPEGFTLSASLQFYGTAENKLANGSIFDYMDGGGEVYLEHGFKELIHGEYTDGRGNAIVLDVFSLTSPEQAQNALKDERICPPAGTPLELGFSGVAYRFPPDYFLYFCQGDLLVYLHVSNDMLAETLDRFAVRIQATCAKEMN